MQTQIPPVDATWDGINDDPSLIPTAIEEQYVGEWIAWDCRSKEVIAHHSDLDKLMPATDAAYAAGRPIYFHHILPPEMLIVGGM